MTSATVTVSVPLRLSLGGGGCDLPEYYLRHGADVLSAAVDRRLTVTVVSGRRDGGPRDPRVALLAEHLGRPVAVEIGSRVPPGSGLGGSGALTVALVGALDLLRGTAPGALAPLDIAVRAYEWERGRLGEPVGFQDQMAAAFGSVTRMRARRDGRIAAERHEDLAAALASMLGGSVRLFASGRTRAAAGQLAAFARGLRRGGAHAGTPADTPAVVEALRARDGTRFGELLRARWERKIALNPAAGWPGLPEAVGDALRHGATGAKVVGAGGGGWLMVAGPETAMREVAEVLARRHALREDVFRVDSTGIASEGPAR